MKGCAGISTGGWEPTCASLPAPARDCKVSIPHGPSCLSHFELPGPQGCIDSKLSADNLGRTTRVVTYFSHSEIKAFLLSFQQHHRPVAISGLFFIHIAGSDKTVEPFPLFSATSRVIPVILPYSYLSCFGLYKGRTTPPAPAPFHPGTAFQAVG